MSNQSPEEKARDNIDIMLRKAGWIVQSKDRINLSAGRGIAVREYQTEVGPADYVLFADRKPVGVIEAKREEEGERITSHEDQAEDYAKSRLKYLDNTPLAFVYERTGVLTHFTDMNDPRPRAKELFTFHRPETLTEWNTKQSSLRTRLRDIPSLDENGLRPAQINAINNLEKSFRANKSRSVLHTSIFDSGYGGLCAART